MIKAIRTSCVFPSLMLTLLWGTSLQLARGDWPTYQGDNHRSGIAAEGLTLPLTEAWTHKAVHPPLPAWPEMPARQDVYRRVYGLSPTVIFDRAFHVVVEGESLYYGSSSDDTIYCLDVSTGKTRWSFSTEGPVRLAPTLSEGKVYAGSDDGCVYCLDAAGGDLLWKHRVGPADRRLPGNGRLMSLWPVRCGTVVDGEFVYSCAGLFPSQGTYLCAVSAASGEAVWKRKVDVSSQGYLLASSSSLFVPTGRTRPHVYRRSDGRQIAAFPGGGKQESGFPGGGGCYAVLVDDLLVHCGGEKGGIQFSNALSREKIISAAGLRLIAKGPIAYVLRKDQLCAVDRAHYLQLKRLQDKKEKTAEDQKRIDELGAARKTYLKWEVPCRTPCEMIMAGDAIFVGGKDEVVAYSAADGGQLWTGTVQGKAYGLAPSGGCLFVSTDKGTIHCFRQEPRQSRPVIVSQRPGSPSRQPYPQDRWTPLYERAAHAAIEAAGVRKGYCLVLGVGTGRLAYQIAKRSEFRIVGVEADASKVAMARELLHQAGLYGGRIVIHQGKLDGLPYQKHFANLITSDETVRSGRLPPSASEVYRLLRPCGGVVVFILPTGDPGAQDLQGWGADVIPGWKVEKGLGGGSLGIARRGILEGAGEWTHFFADAGNSACSQDTIPQGPVDIQWFGRPGPRRMVDRHEKNVGPLYKNGRLFISGDNYILAVDAYNGTVLWERDLPDSIRLGAFKHCGNMVAMDDCLYVASANRCIALDVSSGEEKLALTVPDDSNDGNNEWGYLAVTDDILLGSTTKPGAAFRVQDVDTQVLIWRDSMPVVCSDRLFAVNRHTGKELWTYRPEEGVIVNPTIAVGGGRVYCVGSDNPKTREVADGRIKLDMLLDKGSHLAALDVHTGEVLWKHSARLEALEHVIFLSYAKETLVITGSKNVPRGEKECVRYDLHAFDAATGKPLWQSTQTPVPDHILQGPHGEQVQHSAIVGDTIYNTGFACDLRTGQPIPGWKWQKSDKCGTISTSASCAFSRYSIPRMFDLKSGRFTDLTSVTRPGCWINVIPAGRLILIPEASSGCTCYYSIQTSLALTPRDDK